LFYIFSILRSFVPRGLEQNYTNFLASRLFKSTKRSIDNIWFLKICIERKFTKFFLKYLCASAACVGKHFKAEYSIYIHKKVINK